jgi:hypothetical protein
MAIIAAYQWIRKTWIRMFIQSLLSIHTHNVTSLPTHFESNAAMCTSLDKLANPLAECPASYS